MRGKAFKFGDNISTDHIAPGRLFHLRSDLQEFAKHVLEDADENFAKNMSKGDFVVAGNNFGLGSSREHAPMVIKESGISCVIASTFARIFFRNRSPVRITAAGTTANSLRLTDTSSFSSLEYHSYYNDFYAYMQPD